VEVTIYLDVLWLRSFLVELCVCMFVNQWMRQNKPLLRILWMSAVSVSAEVLLFALAGYGPFAVGSLLLRLLLVFFLFRPQGSGLYVRLLLWSLFGTVMLGGILLLARNRLPEPLWFPLGILATALQAGTALLLEERRRICDQCLYEIMLLHNDGKLRVWGLHDTGNRLMDPYVHRPVHILARSQAQSLHLDPEKCRLIPCATVGDPNGLLPVWTIDGMEWVSRGKRERRDRVLIGIGADALFQGKDYRLILAAGWREQL
jgi:sigma-E processing peptidase SpoIIGA